MRLKDKSDLFQWDVNQVLLEVDGKYIDFPVGNEIYRVAVEDGSCMIPDEFLQREGGKTIYVTYDDGTIEKVSCRVIGRPIPPDYIYTPTERETFDTLVEKVETTTEELVRRADSGEFNGKDGADGKDGKDGVNGKDGKDAIIVYESLPEPSASNYRQIVIITDGVDDRLYINLLKEGNYTWFEFPRGEIGGRAILGQLIIGNAHLGT